MHVTPTPPPPPTGSGATILKIALVMLGVEILIMLSFYWLDVQLPDWQLALVDAGLLAVIVATIAYFFLVRPRDRQVRVAMAALEEARRDAEKLARVDALTGVLSRRALFQTLDKEVERAKRYGAALTCLMLDLDHFKAFNDTYGHQFGDRVLQLIARVISDHCRASDHLGRYGGEEFLIILPETGIDGATMFAERVRSAVARTPLDLGEERITVSIGAAEWCDGDASASKLISRADRALLAAKAAGRDRILASQPAQG